jgi:hypothetical protein
LHKPKQVTKQKLKEEVYKYFTGEGYEPYEMVYFKLYHSRLPTSGTSSVRGHQDGGE